MAGKLSPKDRERLMADLAKDMSDGDLADKYGISKSTVGYYRSGRGGRDKVQASKRVERQGKAVHGARLTLEQRKTAAEDAKGGMSKEDLVQKYGFSEDTARYYIDRYLYGKKKGSKKSRRPYNFLPKELRASVLEAAKTMSPAELVQTYNISERNAQDYVRKMRGTSKVGPSKTAKTVEPQVVTQQHKPALPALKPVLQSDRITVTSDGSTVYIAIPSEMLKRRPELLSAILC